MAVCCDSITNFKNDNLLVLKCSKSVESITYGGREFQSLTVDGKKEYK